MMIDQIYLDFDNTLYDTVALSVDIEKIFLSAGLTKEQFDETMGEATKGKSGTFYNYSFEHHLALCQEKGYSVSADVLEELEQLLTKDLTFPDTYHFLEEMRKRGKMVFVLTAGNPDFQMKKIATTRIAEFIDDIIVCHHKKDEEVALRKAEAKQVWFINDKVTENIAVKEKFSDITVITKRHPIRETEEELKSSGIPYFDTLTEILNYTKQYGQE